MVARGEASDEANQMHGKAFMLNDLQAHDLRRPLKQRFSPGGEAPVVQTSLNKLKKKLKHRITINSLLTVNQKNRFLFGHLSQLVSQLPCPVAFDHCVIVCKASLGGPKALTEMINVTKTG